MAKTVNYTPEMEARLREVYNPEADVHDRDAALYQLVEELGKSAASIRQKLVRMGLYVKDAYTNKNGDKPETKDAIVKAIAEVVKLSDGEADSLAKANKSALLKLRKFVT